MFHLDAGEFVFREATVHDAPFVAEAVVAAESSGTEVFSYARIFGLTLETMKAFLRQIAAEEAAGQDLTHNNYLIAEFRGKPVAACAGWVEAKNCAPSAMIKMQLLTHHLPPEVVAGAKSRLQKAATIHIERTPGALQLESFYVLPEFRGKNLPHKLINEHVKRHKLIFPDLKLAQIVLMRENTQALKSYLKAGFEIAAETRSDDPEISQLLPGTGKYLLQLEIG
jgi:ribosomal protein S18 acetylase RimI-like enzyme